MEKLLSNPLLYLPPETAHKCALSALKLGLVPQQKIENSVHIMGLDFVNPIGLSAGADKKAESLSGWQKIGFGFAEIGTVTRTARTGNAGKRIWRYKNSKEIINWMGLPGPGYEIPLRNLKAFRNRHPKIKVGVSIASPKGHLHDFSFLAETFSPYADYFTLNASCPNTEENTGALNSIKNQIVATVSGTDKPLLLKLGPTNNKDVLEETLNIALNAGAAGLVSTNTLAYENRHFISRPPKWPMRNGKPVGGYSGPQLIDISTKMVSWAREIGGKNMPIIGVGGIHSGQDARAMIEAGANLIQFYTGLIYKGPTLLKEIGEAL